MRPYGRNKRPKKSGALLVTLTRTALVSGAFAVKRWLTGTDRSALNAPCVIVTCVSPRQWLLKIVARASASAWAGFSIAASAAKSAEPWRRRVSK
jgi:hypothetical protein